MLITYINTINFILAKLYSPKVLLPIIVFQFNIINQPTPPNDPHLYDPNWPVKLSNTLKL
jgi:hypothetical protein